MNKDKLKKLSNKALLQYCKNKTYEILNNYLAIEIVNAKLYLISNEDYMKLLQIDALLMPKRTGTRRTSIYSINSIVSIVNPKHIAVSYILNAVEKRKQISNISKIVDTLAREAAVTKNKFQEEFNEYIDNNDIGEDLYNELSRKLQDDFKRIDYLKNDIENNPNKYKNKIKIASNPVLHAQVRYAYLDDKNEKQFMQKHLSSIKPSVLVYDDSVELAKRKDNKINTFLKQSTRVFGDVYVFKELL